MVVVVVVRGCGHLAHERGRPSAHTQYRKTPQDLWVISNMAAVPCSVSPPSESPPARLLSNPSRHAGRPPSPPGSGDPARVEGERGGRLGEGGGCGRYHPCTGEQRILGRGFQRAERYSSQRRLQHQLSPALTAPQRAAVLYSPWSRRRRRTPPAGLHRPRRQGGQGGHCPRSLQIERLQQGAETDLTIHTRTGTRGAPPASSEAEEEPPPRRPLKGPAARP